MKPPTATLAALVLLQAQAFVTRLGSTLLDENGKEFRFGGSNNLYIPQSDKFIVDDFFHRASANNFSVIRTWPFYDTDDCLAASFQCWNGTSLQPVRNETNLQGADYVVYAAKQAGVRLILTLVNNWKDFGGMDMYSTWRVHQAAALGQPFTPWHDSFYTDSVIRGWYQDWVTYLANRVNVYTGVAYKDEPSILAWELANEPQCNGSPGMYNTSVGCIVQGEEASSSPLMTSWVTDMSAFIKSVDNNHLVAVGGQGWYCNGTAQCQRDWPKGDGKGQWWCNCDTGEDFLAFAAAPAVDIATVHMYPDITWQWWTTWVFQMIANHTYQAQVLLNKAVILEEFGWGSNVTNSSYPQHEHYAAWTAYAKEQGMNGWNFWQLVGRIDAPQAGQCDSAYPQWYTCSDSLKIWCNNTAEGDPPLPPGWDYASCGTLAQAAGSMR